MVASGFIYICKVCRGDASYNRRLGIRSPIIPGCPLLKYHESLRRMAVKSMFTETGTSRLLHQMVLALCHMAVISKYQTSKWNIYYKQQRSWHFQFRQPIICLFQLLLPQLSFTIRHWEQPVTAKLLHCNESVNGIQVGCFTCLNQLSILGTLQGLAVKT